MSDFEAQCDCELDSPGVLSHLPVEERLRHWTDWALYLKKRIETHYRPALAAATQRAEKAEAELEALKARRCEGCKHWHGHNYCAEGVAEECDVPELPDHDFACNRWTPKEAAE